MGFSIPKSYEIIGSKESAIAIVEIPNNLRKKEKLIAKEIMKRHKNVKTVLKKLSERKGKYRTREFKILLGSKNTEVLHKEFGCMFKLDPTKVYFSSRESTERFRIANLVKPKETVMVMFAGIGAFPIVIAKHKPMIKQIIAIEISPIAVAYMNDNLRLNKQQEKILSILGNVKFKAKGWFGKCDRIVMPLPHDSWKYFDTALKCIKNKGDIHLYTIASEKDIEVVTKKHMNKYDNIISKYSIKKVLPYAPRINKYCVDIKIKLKRKVQRPHKRR